MARLSGEGNTFGPGAVSKNAFRPQKACLPCSGTGRRREKQTKIRSGHGKMPVYPLARVGKYGR
jgi:hypothetical protein